MTHDNLKAIAALVPQGSRVLDLGCGDGALLAHLQQHKGCNGYGVELDDTNVHACVQRGVNVLQLNLDLGLSVFADQSFDVVLQIDTLQHLRNAETMLRETIRVGTFKDFEVLAEKNGLQVTEAFGLQDGQRVDTWPNLMAGTAVFKFNA
jgi:ubiquinone/menaquinone biosynthesis C-methylase UbiE